jgi:ATP-dependent DNA helicase RecG
MDLWLCQRQRREIAHGVFYSHSGSTKQELKGAALHDFLLRKMGKTWDGICSERTP